MLSIDGTGITIFGRKINFEILILIGVIYLILVGHTVGGCCNVPLIMESMSTITTNTLSESFKSG
jgi:hypothetical protein